MRRERRNHGFEGFREIRRQAHQEAKIADFRVQEGRSVNLKKWPTRVDPAYSSKDDYEARLARQVQELQRYRSDFRGEVTDFQDNRQLTFVKGERTVDLQVSYELQSGPAKGLSIIFQGNNLTKTAFQRFRPDTGAIVENVPTGKTYLLGLNYKL